MITAMWIVYFFHVFISKYSQQNNSHIISNFARASTEERPRQTAEVKCSALMGNEEYAMQSSLIFEENIMFCSIAVQFY